MTTEPPFDRSSVSLFAGFAATSAGAARLGTTGAAGCGAGLAAISANASGNNDKALTNIDLPGILCVIARYR